MVSDICTINFPLYARLARAEAAQRRNAGFVMAARLTGNTDSGVGGRTPSPMKERPAAFRIA
jgi:ABC-type dipeptide/oligopeptide/nickel transport system permease subunit